MITQAAGKSQRDQHIEGYFGCLRTNRHSFPNWQLRLEDNLAPSVAALFYAFDATTSIRMTPYDVTAQCLQSAANPLTFEILC